MVRWQLARLLLLCNTWVDLRSRFQVLRMQWQVFKQQLQPASEFLAFLMLKKRLLSKFQKLCQKKLKDLWNFRKLIFHIQKISPLLRISAQKLHHVQMWQLLAQLELEKLRLWIFWWDSMISTAEKSQSMELILQKCRGMMFAPFLEWFFKIHGFLMVQLLKTWLMENLMPLVKKLLKPQKPLMPTTLFEPYQKVMIR